MAGRIHMARSRDIDGGWAWVVLASGVGSLFITGYLCYSNGILTTTMLDVFEEDLSWTSAVAGVLQGVMCATGPVAGIIINRYGCRTCTILGGIISTIGLAGASFSQNLWTVMWTFGVLTGIGYGLGYTSAIVKVGFNFNRLRPLATGIAVAGAEAACMIHLPNYCVQQGTSKRETAFLITVMGIVNIFARILTGFTANDERISKLTLIFGHMTIAGVFTGLFPLYSMTYGGQMAYAAVLGLYSSSLNSLMSPVAVQLVGIEELATAFGLVSLVAGVGCLVGPPIAGAIVDYGATYRESFIFAASAYLMAGIFAILIPLFHSEKDDHVISDLNRRVSLMVEVTNETTPCMVDKNETNTLGEFGEISRITIQDNECSEET